MSAIFGTDSPMYARVWVVTLPILMSVQVATVLEAYTKLISQYRGLGAFGPKLLTWCLVLLVIATCISVAWDSEHITGSILEAALFTYRYVAFILAGCLALPCLVLWRFPKPDQKPARNIRVHLWMLVIYFCVYIVGFLAVNESGVQETNIRVINLIMLVILCGLYGSWAFVLTPAGEAFVPWPKLASDLAALMDAHNDAALQRGEELKQRRGT
ncbi:MAG: hypothetical protein ACR2IV_07755 [Bryobacteraceae bacterium]